ncbi:hypothetical protein BC835DRAFT_1365484 [Cytidiella melzeri]|nr:hypothetical protein BC835DRAFT_1365484 [Cytidiella melzeri]
MQIGEASPKREQQLRLGETRLTKVRPRQAAERGARLLIALPQLAHSGNNLEPPSFCEILNLPCSARRGDRLIRGDALQMSSKLMVVTTALALTWNSLIGTRCGLMPSGQETSPLASTQSVQNKTERETHELWFRLYDLVFPLYGRSASSCAGETRNDLQIGDWDSLYKSCFRVWRSCLVAT